MGVSRSSKSGLSPDAVMMSRCSARYSFETVSSDCRMW